MSQKLVLAIALCIASSSIAADLPGTLIVGGEEATKNQFPYIVRLWVFPTDGSFRICSGTLIALDLVLTSAGCVEKYSKQIIVTAGDHSITESDGTEQSLTSQQVIIHENFDLNNRTVHDIALIKLYGKFEQTEAVQPITLPRANLNPDLSEYGIVAGWGAKNLEEFFQDKLHTANLRIFETAQCAAFPRFELGEGNFCTLDTKGGMQSDRGGPLICNEMPGAICGIMSTSYIQVGAQGGILGVYVNVSAYLDWIEANTPVDPTTTVAPTETSSIGTSPSDSSSTGTTPTTTSPTTTGPSGTSPTTTVPPETAGSASLAASLLLTFISALYLLL